MAGNHIVQVENVDPKWIRLEHQLTLGLVWQSRDDLLEAKKCQTGMLDLLEAKKCQAGMLDLIWNDSCQQ